MISGSPRRRWRLQALELIDSNDAWGYVALAGCVLAASISQGRLQEKRCVSLFVLCRSGRLLNDGFAWICFCHWRFWTTLAGLRLSEWIILVVFEDRSHVRKNTLGKEQCTVYGNKNRYFWSISRRLLVSPGAIVTKSTWINYVKNTMLKFPAAFKFVHEDVTDLFRVSHFQNRTFAISSKPDTAFILYNAEKQLANWNTPESICSLHAWYKGGPHSVGALHALFSEICNIN